jgi:hypothetical protein
MLWCESQAKLEELERECLESNSNMERLQRSYAELMELQLVLEKAGSFFDAKTTRALGGAGGGGGLGSYADGESPLLEAQVCGRCSSEKNSSALVFVFC